jgi:hypothetical protein
LLFQEFHHAVVGNPFLQGIGGISQISVWWLLTKLGIEEIEQLCARAKRFIWLEIEAIRRKPGAAEKNSTAVAS